MITKIMISESSPLPVCHQKPLPVDHQKPLPGHQKPLPGGHQKIGTQSTGKSIQMAK